MSEQQLYARWLKGGTTLALAALVAAFAAYVSGLAQPLVPLETLPALWSLPVDRYIAATGAPTGWGWLVSLDKAESLNLAGVALLSLVTLACYARIVPGLLRRRENVLAILALCQVAVLIIAISTAFAAVR